MCRRIETRNRTLALPAAVVAVMCVSPLQAQSISELRAILRARNESVQSFRAEITVISKPGTEREQLAAAQLQLADWVDRNKPELSTAAIRDSIARMSKGGPVTTRKYRYTAARDGKFRIEELDKPDSKPASVKQVRLYNGTEWQSYNAGRDESTGETASGLVIRQREPTLAWFEIARGAGVLLSAGMSMEAHPFELEHRAHDLSTVDWRDLLRNLSEKHTTLSMSPPPGGTSPVPSLIFETAPFREGAPGAYRLQVSFDPGQSFAVTALVESVPTPSGDGGWTHQPRFTATWSDPITLDGGIPFFRKCLLRHYELALTPMDGRPETDWPQRPFETMQVEHSFENVKLNEPADVALFDVKPAPGTHVIDERKGFTYILGKAGEELEKTAIAERDRKPVTAAPTGRAGWRTIFIAANLIALLALIAYRIAVERRKRSRL